MATKLLDAVEIQTGARPTATVLWLHGLGADGHDFEPVVPELVRADERPLRFLFPHAPVRPVTINGGMAMRAWYDIVAFDRARQDEAGIRGSGADVAALLRRENERGIPTSRIVLAGFSQGGAISLFAGLRYPEALAGIIGLSCYLPLDASLATERAAANRHTPIFLAHGRQDPVVDFRSGNESRELLEAAGYAVQWHAYPMAHSVCPQEIADIAAWLRQVLP